MGKRDGSKFPFSKNGKSEPSPFPKKEGGNQMKATGVVRRIDDLGRVVIPKEIRKTLRIKERRAVFTLIGTIILSWK